jgi:hypothetical protein
MWRLRIPGLELGILQISGVLLEEAQVLPIKHYINISPNDPPPFPYRCFLLKLNQIFLFRVVFQYLQLSTLRLTL